MARAFQQTPIKLGASGQSPVPKFGEALMSAGMRSGHKDIGTMAQSIIGALLAKQGQRNADAERKTNAADFQRFLQIFAGSGDATGRPTAGRPWADEASVPPGGEYSLGGEYILGDGSRDPSVPRYAAWRAEDQTNIAAALRDDTSVRPGSAAAFQAALEAIDNPTLIAQLGPALLNMIAQENQEVPPLTGKDRFIKLDKQLIDLGPTGSGEPVVVISSSKDGQDPTAAMQNVAAALGYDSVEDAMSLDRVGFMKGMAKYNARSGMDFNVNMGDRKMTPEERQQLGFAVFDTEEAVSIAKQARESAEVARGNQGLIRQMRELTKGLNTGFGSGVLQFVQKLALSIDDDLLDPETKAKVAKMEALDSGNITVALAVFAAMTKGAITDTETALFRQAAPGLSNTKEGNLLIIDMIEEGLNRAIAKDRFVRKWRSDHKNTLTGTDEEGRDFFDAWDAAHENFDSLFQRRLDNLNAPNIAPPPDVAPPSPTLMDAYLDQASKALDQGAPQEQIYNELDILGIPRQRLLDMRSSRGPK